MSSTLTRSAVLAAMLLLAGCAGLPERLPVADPAAVWDSRQSALARLNNWDLHGRLALRTDDEGAHASLHWVRRNAVHRMNLAGPFGGGRVRVVYDENSAELRDSNGDVYRGNSVQQLLERVTGWWLPLNGLNYWVLGLPEPGVTARTELDEWGRLRTLDQQGWRIEFLEYTEQAGFELPKRLFVSRQSPDKDVLEARIAIERWALTPVSARR